MVAIMVMVTATDTVSDTVAVTVPLAASNAVLDITGEMAPQKTFLVPRQGLTCE